MPPFLTVSIILFIIWLVVFFLSKLTRKEQILMSFIGLILSPGALYLAHQDYRASYLGLAASIGIEDLLFAFSLFGLAAVAYQALLGKQAKPVGRARHKIQNPALHWGTHLLIIFSLWIFVSLLSLILFAVTSVTAFVIGGVMIGIYIIADRKDLLYNALFSGLIIAILVFLIEQLFFVRLYPQAAAIFWQFDDAYGLVLGGIPLLEILWAGVVGFTVGPLYEYVRNWKLN
ncbi:MAG: lycopene cyclase domain-containing protein [Patescibacteria group bacterium]